MEMLQIAVLIVASGLTGALIMRQHDVKKINQKQRLADDCYKSLCKAVRLNDQMLHMLEGKSFQEALTLAEIDEIWRLNP